MSGAWDFTVAETGIVDRLKVATQQGAGKWAREVATREDLAGVAEEMQNAPAIYTVYDGFVVKSADEYVCALVHRFLAVLVVKNAAAQREAAPINKAAGPKMKSIFEALHGFQPPGCSSRLVPASPPRPFYSPGGFAYFPLAFTAESNHSVPNLY